MKNTFAAIKFWMDKILSIACAVLLTFMTVLVLIQVFSRYILNSPVAFTEELVRYSLIWTGVYRCSLRILHPRAYVPDAGAR